MINHGMIEDTESDYVGKGYDQSHRLYLFVTADEYTGTALLNEEDGNIYGELEAYASGFDGGCLVNNKGSMEIDGSRFCVGLKVSEIERWDAFSTGFENSWRHCEVKYVLDPAVSIKNSTIIKDVGNSRMMHTESVVSGKGEGDNTFWHMSSGKHLIAQRYDIFMYGSGMTGLMIDSGTALAPDDDDFCDIDVMIGENPDNAVTAFGKTLFNGENCKNSVCFKNYGIINNGTVGSTEENRFRFKAELYGSESVGFYNNGTFDVRSVEGQVGGTLNTGILNLTSIDADETVSGYAIGNRELEGSLISGGNIGIDNPGIIHANSLVATAGDRDFEYHKVTSMTEGKEGKDVGVKSTGIIELVLSKNNTGANFGPHSYSPAGVGLFTSGSLSARNLTILNTYGTAMQCAEGSVTYVSWLEVGGYNGQQDYDKYYCLGISLAGILELRTNEAGGQSQIKISASHGRMGMQITETGSLINRTNDYKNYNYFGAYGSGSICVSNYGHIDVGLVDVTKSDGAKYTDVISDHGIFSYKKPDNWTQDRHYEEGPYGMAEYPGCAGPWSGVFYHPGTLD